MDRKKEEHRGRTRAGGRVDGGKRMGRQMKNRGKREREREKHTKGARETRIGRESSKRKSK